MNPLVTAAQLRSLLESDAPPVVLDVRWALGDTSGHRKYLESHIPGAVYVDLDRDLSAPSSAADGRHPLPALTDLQSAARRWGIRSDTGVVVYDAAANTAAARAWWLLRWAGVENVTLLDGGLAAWTASGFDVRSGPEPEVPLGDVALREGHLPTLDGDGVAELTRTGIVLDARAAERYSGLVEPVDPRAGHIPGAVSAPTSDNLSANGQFLSPAELRARFERLGVTAGTQVGVYCGSGVTAAHQIAALAVAGFDAALYPGSWSQWSSDPERPVAVEG